MRQVKLEEMVDFGTLVGEVEAGGEGVTVMRGGKPVAQVIPFPLPERPIDEAKRLEAVKRLCEIMDAGAPWRRLTGLMDQGVDLGGVWNGRDELYERD